MTSNDSLFSLPEGRLDVVLDTDTYNEADDQFALSYMVRHEERFHVCGLYAAPFYNFPERAKSPAEGMERSYQEILTLLKLLKREDLNSIVKRGSTRYLSIDSERWNANLIGGEADSVSENAGTATIEAVDSEAARDLIRLAKEHSPENPLYVVAIGCITNVASALLLAPEIKDSIFVVWLGGHSLDWPDIAEFNLKQDVAAARVVMSSGVRLTLLPCMGVVSEFAVTKEQVRDLFMGKNELLDYLAEGIFRFSAEFNDPRIWPKVIWDVCAVAWLMGDFEEDTVIPAPLPGYDLQWHLGECRHSICYVTKIHKEELLQSLLETLS